MDLTQIPFAKMIALKEATSPAYIFELSNDEAYTNHLGTVAAAAQFSLAEFATGQWLINAFPDFASNCIPVLRKSDVKFRKPATGKVSAKIIMDDNKIEEIRMQLTANRRTLINVPVEVHNEEGICVMQGNYEWFIQLT